MARKWGDDRRVIISIVDVIKSGCRWCDCPLEYSPPTTIYDRLVREAERGLWERMFRALAAKGRATVIDSNHIKTHRPASRKKGGDRAKRLDARAAGATRKSTQSRSNTNLH